MAKSDYTGQIVIPIILALLVGGSSPWWWDKFFKHSDSIPTDTKEYSQLFHVDVNGANNRASGKAIRISDSDAELLRRLFSNSRWTATKVWGEIEFDETGREARYTGKVAGVIILQGWLDTPSEPYVMGEWVQFDLRGKFAILVPRIQTPPDSMSAKSGANLKTITTWNRQ